MRRDHRAVQAEVKLVANTGHVDHLHRIEANMLEVQPALARHLLIKTAAAQIAVAGLDASVMDHVVRWDRLTARVAKDGWHGGKVLQEWSTLAPVTRGTAASLRR